MKAVRGFDGDGGEAADLSRAIVTLSGDGRSCLSGVATAPWDRFRTCAPLDSDRDRVLIEREVTTWRSCC